ncbi:YciK family oxidoreductase [Sulfurivermis fontis]|uniref:YciK family oxidoreductase n=1 Tax=Sulfurivermis fontis TaxID=1972068 RepID=UPI000FDBC4DF|nr:YciK family oxidoreductase [Sulfurivermis fontis]
MHNYKPAPDLLKDRVILVTGAGDGIGAAAAKAFAAHGATVILLGRSARKLEKVYDDIEQNGGPQPALVPLNLEKAVPEQYLELATMVEKEFGRLDGLLHNAALLGTLTPLEQYDLKQWAQLMQVNLHAPYLLTRALLPLLKNSEDASVLFTSSGVGRKGRAYWGAYAITKAANENMMEIWADELETNTRIRVNSIDPGAVRTSMRAKAYPGEDPNNLPRPEEIMTVYLYLMGPDSRGTTGQRTNAQ